MDNTIIQNSLQKTKGYNYLLADSAYDSENIKNKLKEIKMRSIIKPNNRNTKDKKKIRKLNKQEKKKYKKRINVEHFFGIIKKSAKINCIYEKLISSYEGLVLFLTGSILLNRSIER